MQKANAKPSSAPVFRSAKFNRPRSAQRLQRANHRPAGVLEPKTLLWIDDYQPALEVYSAIFQQFGFRVLVASRPKLGIQIAASTAVDAVITDYEMPGMNGGAVAAVLKSRNPRLPVIVFTGITALPARVRKVADACCDKAAPIEQLLFTLKRLLALNATPLRPQSLRTSSEQGQRTVA